MTLQEWVDKYPGDPEALQDALVVEIERLTTALQEATKMDKYMRPGLDFAVGKATEEAGEFLAAIGKTLRWGWHSVNPKLPRHEQETNVNWVRREMADLRHALNNLEREMDQEFMPSFTKQNDDYQQGFEDGQRQGEENMRPEIDRLRAK